MIDEILEHVEKIINIISEDFDEDLAIVEELTHELKDELESLQDK